MQKIIALFSIALLILLAACSRHEISYQGYIDGEYTQVASNLSGTLITLAAERGQHLKKGQLLFALDPEPELSQYKEAQEHLDSAQANLKNLQTGQRDTVIKSLEAQKDQAEAAANLSKINLDRSRDLYAKQAIGKAVLDQAEATYLRDANKVNEVNANLAEAKLGARQFLIRAQEGNVEAAKAMLAQASWKLMQKTIYSPITGQVFDRYYRVGEFVGAQRPVVSLLSLDNIKLVFFVPEPDRSRFRINQIVFLTCDGCKKRYPARINFISPQAEYTPPVIFSRESRAKLVYRFEAKLTPTEASTLYPGQPVDVHVK